MYVYKSPILDLSVDRDRESNGYYPGVKGSYIEQFVHNKYCDSPQYEDRSIKHLYEQHHRCTESGPCERFCRMRLIEGNHKRDDLFNLKNEEMVCTECPVNYDKLQELYVERGSIDEKQKAFAYSMLIPPPCLDDSNEEVRVYITEINADLSCDFLSPHTIQDPVYMSYDEDTLQIRLSEPLLSFDDPSYVRQKWHRQSLLGSLNGIMHDYGCVQSVQCFSTFKFNLLSMCNTSAELFFDASNLFYENFILDVVVHCLHYAMKVINDQVVHLCGQCRFRPIFSPSVVSLLKALNMLRRSFDLSEDLTALDLINEKNGSIIGALIEEHNDLLNRADANMCDMRNEEGSGVFRLDNAFGVGNPSNDDHKTMNDLQTKMSVFNVLFDVYKILSIELHRGDKMSFMACCPTCTNGYLMKEEYQAFVDSIRECLPMRNTLIDNEEDPIQMKRMLLGSMTFMESQCGDRNFIQSFVTQADISRQSSHCDLVPPSLRSANFHSRKNVSRRFTNTMKFEPQKKVCDVLNNLSNRCLTVRT